jgi:hypothetical protein
MFYNQYFAVSSERTLLIIRIYSYWVWELLCISTNALRSMSYNFGGATPSAPLKLTPLRSTQLRNHEIQRKNSTKWRTSYPEVSGFHLFARVLLCLNIACSILYSGLEYFISSSPFSWELPLLVPPWPDSPNLSRGFLKNFGHQTAKLHLWALQRSQPLLARQLADCLPDWLTD